MRCVEEWPQAPRRASPKRVARLQDARILGDHVAGAVSLNRVVDTIQVRFLGISEARQPQRLCGRLALSTALVVRRAGQFVPHSAVGQQPGKATVR